MQFSKWLPVFAVWVAGLSITAFSACVEGPGPSKAEKEDAIELTSAHLSSHGDSILVTGIAGGVETNIVASKVIIEDGADMRILSDASSLPQDDDVQCFVCVCVNHTCRCVPIACN
jgi:hypothetical protein